MLIITSDQNAPFTYEGKEYGSIYAKSGSCYLYQQDKDSFQHISPFSIKEILQQKENQTFMINKLEVSDGGILKSRLDLGESGLPLDVHEINFDEIIENEMYETDNTYQFDSYVILKENKYEFDLVKFYADIQKSIDNGSYYSSETFNCPTVISVLLALDNNQNVANLPEIIGAFKNEHINKIIPLLNERNALLLFEKIQQNPLINEEKNKFILSQFIKEYKILDQISKSSLFPYSVEAAVKCDFNEPLAFAYKDSINDVLTLKDNSEYLAYFLKNSINMDVLKACLIDVANLTQTVKDYPNLEKIAKNMQLENLTVGNKIKFQSKDGVVELPFNQVLALIKQNPVNAQNLIDKNEYVEQLAIKSSPSSAKILPDMTPDQQILFYNEHRHLSSLIKNPSVELQVHAVKQNPNHIALFKNPCEQAQIVSVQQFPRNIALIENPCEIAQNIAVKKDPETLNLIDSPLESVKKIAVLELPSMIASIDNPSEELRDLSLRNGYSIFHLDNPTEKEIEKAIFNSPELVDQFPKSIQNLTAAHNSNPDIVESLSFSSADEIKNAIIATKYYTGKEDMPVPPIFINKEIQNLSLDHSGGVTFPRFKHLCDDQTVEKAVSLLPSNIKHIESPSPKLQMIAIEKDPSCISYIKNPDKVVEIRAGALSMIQRVEFNKETDRKLGNDNNLSNDMGIKL